MTGPTLVARRPGVDVASGAASSFGTFGELLQGALQDGTEFLVTLPVSRFARAWFRYDAHGPLRVFPSHKTKSLRLAAAMLAEYAAGAGGVLVLDSDLPIGKGMASSSADLVATARAVGGVLGADVSPEAVEAWLRPIEPTDGVMHPGVVAFDHRDVRLRGRLGVLPPMAIVAVDEGGAIDTVAYNERPKHYTDAHRDEYGALLSTLSEAAHTGNLAEIGRVATRSAVLNQRLVPKRHLDEMLAIAAGVGALGVVCAHSGTMLGLLLDAADPAHRRRLAAARAACTALSEAPLVIRTLTFHDTEHIHAA